MSEWLDFKQRDVCHWNEIMRLIRWPLFWDHINGIKSTFFFKNLEFIRAAKVYWDVDVQTREFYIGVYA